MKTPQVNEHRTPPYPWIATGNDRAVFRYGGWTVEVLNHPSRGGEDELDRLSNAIAGLWACTADNVIPSVIRSCLRTTRAVLVWDSERLIAFAAATLIEEPLLGVTDTILYHNLTLIHPDYQGMRSKGLSVLLPAILVSGIASFPLFPCADRHMWNFSNSSHDSPPSCIHDLMMRTTVRMQVLT